jgi:hypothetical protein
METLNWPKNLPAIGRSNLVKGTHREKFHSTCQEILEEFEYIMDYTPNRYTGYTIPNPEKATNLLLYFLSNCNPEFNDKLKLNKMLFYTDFFNYKETGRSISGISYRAIPYGPVPSNYDFIFAHFIEKEEIIEPVFIKINQTKVNECYKLVAG